jgi:hypothetical protein
MCRESNPEFPKYEAELNRDVWLDHAARMDEDMWRKLVSTYKSTGRRMSKEMPERGFCDQHALKIT